MSNSENIIKQLTDYLVTKDRQIADLEELVKQQSRTILDYFTVQDTLRRVGSMMGTPPFPAQGQMFLPSMEPVPEKIPVTLVMQPINDPPLPKIEYRFLVNNVSTPSGCCRTTAHDLCIRLSDNAVIGSFEDQKFVEKLTIKQTLFCDRLGLKIDIPDDYGGCG